MNSNQAANLNLCQELYSLTKWRNTHAYYVMDDGKPYLGFGQRPNGLNLPAYDLGYLLRKLPYKLPNTHINHWLTISMGAASGVAKYTDSDLVKRGDTPEDAACRLAIELIRQGVVNGLVENEPLASQDVAKKPCLVDNNGKTVPCSHTASTSVNREGE